MGAGRSCRSDGGGAAGSGATTGRARGSNSQTRNRIVSHRPAASPFGIPGRNGAEIVIEALNAGKAPAPCDKVGFGGIKIDAKYVDESGSAANVVTEYRNLVQRDQVNAVVGYISSGSCLAVTPVAEELKALTVFYDCGTPRIFEEKARNYVFRVSPHATMDNVAAARYLLAKKKGVTSYSGINQNYAWGQDSWRDFVGAMKVLAPNVTSDKVCLLYT